jgi:hypothetical protein
MPGARGPRDLLSGGHPYTDAVALTPGEKEQYQVRSIVKFAGGKVYKGVFGRCRFGEKPVQGSALGERRTLS